MIWSVIIGAIAGWLAGVLFKGSGFGLLVNIIVGIVGGWIGSLVFGLIGFSGSGFVARIIISLVGAVILLWLVGWLSKKLKK